MWYFVSPQIVFGEGALDALTDLQGERAFLVTDANLVRLGLVGEVQRRLEKAGFCVEVFDAVEPDPSLQTVRLGAEKARAFAPDWIVGLGGGSPLDAAKAIWILYERPDLDPAEINPFITLGLRRKARLATIPTTSGTGAEVTWAIVLTDLEAGRKLGLGNRENVADIAIVDPALVAGMPPQLAADTGLDALTHAIEGYTCTWANDMSDGPCLHATKLIFHYLARAVNDPADSEAREKMHNAATLAGLGFGNALASMAHAMGHSLGARFHIPHGRAVGIFLPYTIEFIAAEAPERFAELAAYMGLGGGEPQAMVRAFTSAIRALCLNIGAPVRIADLNISRMDYEAQLDTLVETTFNDSAMLPVARCPSVEELQRLFLYAYDGTPVDF